MSNVISKINRLKSSEHMVMYKIITICYKGYTVGVKYVMKCWSKKSMFVLYHCVLFVVFSFVYFKTNYKYNVPQSIFISQSIFLFLLIKLLLSTLFFSLYYFSFSFTFFLFLVFYFLFLVNKMSKECTKSNKICYLCT